MIQFGNLHRGYPLTNRLTDDVMKAPHLEYFLVCNSSVKKPRDQVDEFIGQLYSSKGVPYVNFNLSI